MKFWIDIGNFCGGTSTAIQVCTHEASPAIRMAECCLSTWWECEGKSEARRGEGRKWRVKCWRVIPHHSNHQTRSLCLWIPLRACNWINYSLGFPQTAATSKHITKKHYKYWVRSYCLLKKRSQSTRAHHRQLKLAKDAEPAVRHMYSDISFCTYTHVQYGHTYAYYGLQ